MGRQAKSNSAHAKPRPPLLRALGEQEPPETIELDGISHHRLRVFKHDSWAATALYDGPRGLVVCKFHRQQPIGKLPMSWLGRQMARRERNMLARLGDLPGIPALSGNVSVGGKALPYAVAHAFVPGHPLGAKEEVNDKFFPRLQELLAEMHRRGIAYVDLHKRENIIVGDDGLPYLIDFQIGFVLRDWWLARSLIGRAILRILQQSDVYHLNKHIAKCRPEQQIKDIERPIWIRLHRLIAQPFRAMRRRMLVTFGVRTGRGRVETEAFAEEGLRDNPIQRKAA